MSHDPTYIPILFHRKMDLVDNSTQVASHTNLIEGSVMGTTDESKTTFAEEKPNPQKIMCGTGKESKKKKQKLYANGNPIEKKRKKGGKEHHRGYVPSRWL